MLRNGALKHSGIDVPMDLIIGRVRPFSEEAVCECQRCLREQGDIELKQ